MIVASAADMYTVDESLPGTLRSFLGTFFRTAGIIVVVVYSTPMFSILILPLTVFYIVVQRFYVCTSRQVCTRALNM
jgi:hypothetical protein